MIPLFSNSNKILLSGIILSDISDHNPIFSIEETFISKDIHPQLRPDLSTENMGIFCNYLQNHDWEPLLCETNTINAFDYFYTKLTDFTEASFPLKAVKLKKCNNVPWMTPGILISRKTKNKLFSKKTNNPSISNIDKYKTYKSLYNKVCRSAKINFTKETYTNLKNDSKKLWTLINTSIGRKTKKGMNVPNFFKENELIFDNFVDIAEGFNDFFINIGDKLQSKLPRSPKNVKDYLGTPCPFNFVFNLINDSDILLACSRLKPKTSQGLDILSNKLIKMLFPKILPVIKKLINLSLKSGIVPSQLKQLE